MLEPLLFEVKEKVGYLIFNRPKVHNAMNFEMATALNQVINRIESRYECRALIFRGCGEKSFMSGSDIDELKMRTVQTGLETSQLRKDIFLRIERLAIPTIAAVNGYALGIGCELALVCTVRIASENARFGFPEINLGIIPGAGGTQRLPRIIGKSKAAELILTGKIIDALEAMRIGLVNHVVPLKELDGQCTRLANELISKPPIALKLALQALNISTESEIGTGSIIETLSLGICFFNEDSKEGLTAFLEKRKPRFRGN